jgi:formylglycine-generating enzyme required for sulfatase activity
MVFKCNPIMRKTMAANTFLKIYTEDARPSKSRRISAMTIFSIMFLVGGCVSHHEIIPAPNPLMGRPWNFPLPNNTTLDMSWIPPATFTMGSPASEPLRKADEGPQTRITLSKGFWLGKTMVTIGQWKSVMGLDVRGQLGRMLHDDTLYDLGGKRQTVRDFMRFPRDADPGQYLANEDDNLPMYFVSWNDAMEFCKILNERERATGRLPKGYELNLPTEAQWEYACRAGTTDATYAGPLVFQEYRSPVLDSIAWYDANSPDDYAGNGFNIYGHKGGPRPVAQKQPNAWGLYDMEGGIWEWCHDWYGIYPGGNLTDPGGPITGTDRVNRGGSFGSGAGDERSANRARNPPAEASAYRGFRLALSPVP